MKKIPWRFVGLIAVLAFLVVFAARFSLKERMAALQGWIETLGPWGPLVYVGVYAAAVVAMIPGSALTLLAGALFGSVKGLAIVSMASTLGATLAFLVSRYVARSAVEAWLGQKESFRKLDAMTRRRGALLVALTRLVPIFPFNLLNYGLGLTQVSLKDYVFWSWLCMLPGTALYVVGADAVVKAFTQGRVPRPLAGALVLLLVFLGWLGKSAKKKLSVDSESEKEKVS